MTILRFRITGSRSAVDTIITRLHGIDQLERVEEVDDEMANIDDDSSSGELPDDVGPGVHRIEVETPHAADVERVHNLVEISTRDLDVAVEFLERF